MCWGNERRSRNSLDSAKKTQAWVFIEMSEESEGQTLNGELGSRRRVARSEYFSSLQRKIYVACLALLCTALLLERLRVLVIYAFKWADEDQALMWYAVTEFARGRFHEPRFFGQTYNTMLEALLAVPLWLGGVQLHHAIPVVTSTLALTPFLAIAYKAWRKDLLMATLGALTVPLTLPVEFAMCTSMPRGFVPGLFIAGVAASLDFSEAKARSAWRWLLFGFTTNLAVSVNPNALVVVFPLAVYTVPLLLKQRAMVGWAGAGAALAATLHWIVQDFYELHPELVVFHAPRLRFSLSALIEGLQHLNDHFGYAAPLGGGRVLLLILFAVILLSFSLSRSWRGGVAALAGILLIYISLGVPKAHDGYVGVFQPLARMYLGIPLFIALCLLWLEETLAARPSWLRNRTLPVLAWSVCAMLALVSFGYKECILSRRIAWHMSFPSSKVTAITVDHVSRECRTVKTIAAEQNVKLVIFDTYMYAAPLDYGCVEVFGNELRSVFPAFERRTWLLHEEGVTKRTRFLFYGFVYPLLASANAMGATIINVPLDPLAHVVVTPQPISAVELLSSLGMRLKRYKGLHSLIKSHSSGQLHAADKEVAKSISDQVNQMRSA